MAWQPEEGHLRELARCLKDSLAGNDKVAQKQAEQMLAQAKHSPDINNYLIYLFSSSDIPPSIQVSATEYQLVRVLAAVTLKNHIKTGYKSIDPTSLALIRSSVPLALHDSNQQIRNHAGNIITELVARGGLLSWPEILPHLIEVVSNTTGNVSNEAQEGAMTALLKICEDNKKLLDKEYNGQRPLNVLVPKLIEFTQSPVSAVRTKALTSINEFIPNKPQAILVALDSILQQLFRLASDEAPTVRKQVCRAFTLIVDVRPDKILPYIGDLVDYILQQQQMTDDEDLACDAAEFWLSVGEHPDLWQSLAPYLHKIIPVLLKSMVYSEDDIADLGGDGDDADQDDRAEDIKPQFARGKAARNADEASEAGQNGDAYTKLPGDDSFDDYDEGEIEESDDDDDDGFNPEDAWNLRKCSAAALDVFASDFRGPVFEAILPYLMTNLRHEDWPHREAAVLALGAVAQGCMEVVEPHLPDLVPYLISLLNDSEPLVRQITCWTLGRYSAWAASLNDPADRERFFVPTMEGLLMKMLDRNKRVQEAAASAFAYLEEKAGQTLIPYCEPIVRQFVMCFDRYKDKNMFILYDCIQTLAENVGPALTAPQLVNVLMPALIKRWKRVSDQSRELFPMLECLSFVATAYGAAFSQFAPPIFARCIRIIHENLEEQVRYNNNESYDEPDKDFLVTSLDLLSAIIQVLPSEESASLVTTSEPNFFQLLNLCMQDVNSDVRQSAYALLGDCAKFVAPQLGAYIHNMMPVLLKQLDLDEVMEEQVLSGFSVTNNACWSLGEIAIRHGESVTPYINDLLRRLIQILTNKSVPSSVIENAAIALGRLGLENSEAIAPHLREFANLFLTAMNTVDYTDEKTSAFTGFTMAVGQNPQAMESVLPHFFTSIARYETDFAYLTTGKSGLAMYFKEIIKLYKQLMPNGAFEDYITKNVPAPDVQKLRENYQL